MLLDTNIIIGLLAGTEAAVASFRTKNVPLARCSVSVITRIEVLSWQGMTPEADTKARALLAGLRVLPIIEEIEVATIALRRSRKVKLPDALIAATAQAHGLQLLTLDQGLLSVFNDSN
ncbi:type II toxin-antitoxin system VapC family toxin [Chitinibacter sp. FCG-7]|uniref:Type II toxin-antitoxin system VapC family toxin n=1 Tax=Chitinibacter mangrovi TaxID=3153927 RepID=A0AAU7F6V3_9NEIS